MFNHGDVSLFSEAKAVNVIPAGAAESSPAFSNAESSPAFSNAESSPAFSNAESSPAFSKKEKRRRLPKYVLWH
jgi:hypothetical protein